MTRASIARLSIADSESIQSVPPSKRCHFRHLTGCSPMPLLFFTCSIHALPCLPSHANLVNLREEPYNSMYMNPLQKHLLIGILLIPSMKIRLISIVSFIVPSPPFCNFDNAMSIKAFLTSLNRLKSKMSVPVAAGDVRTQSGIR